MKSLAAERLHDLSQIQPAVTAGNDWHARLSLGFANDRGTTRLVERSHHGPLLVQKPLYPEGPAVCHAILIHPPGGVVGGDQLSISTRVEDTAAAFITTPGAAKWYKANGKLSRQVIELEVGKNAALEWLPQETIFFNAAQVHLEQNVKLAADANYIGAEILCFGRTASGECFNQGKITQRTQIRRADKLIWFEQGALAGGSDAMKSPLALAGYTVSATLIAVGQALSASAMQALRDETSLIASDQGKVGATQMKQVCVLRFLGNSSEVAKQVVTCAWRHLRPLLLRREAIAPRIWHT